MALALHSPAAKRIRGALAGIPHQEPALDLDFANQSLRVNGKNVGFGFLTRSGGAGGTVVGADGSIMLASAPRFDFDPVSRACKGLLVEEQRTNLLLNSLVDGTNLSTQSVTVTAVAHTLTFAGTGSVTLSGASTAGPLVGASATTRSSLTFTPSAGSLTLTVSGGVKYANLEVGLFGTSHIPTAGTAVTRTADSVTVTGRNFLEWFNASEGTFVCHFDKSNNAFSGRAFTVSDGTGNQNIRLNGSISTAVRTDWQIVDGGVVQANVLGGQVAVGAKGKVAASYAANDFISACDGVLASQDAAGTVPSVNQIALGANELTAGGFLNGHIALLSFIAPRRPGTALQRTTA